MPSLHPHSLCPPGEVWRGTSNHLPGRAEPVSQAWNSSSREGTPVRLTPAVTLGGPTLAGVPKVPSARAAGFAALRASSDGHSEQKGKKTKIQANKIGE